MSLGAEPLAPEVRAEGGGPRSGLLAASSLLRCSLKLLVLQVAGDPGDSLLLGVVLSPPALGTVSGSTCATSSANLLERKAWLVHACWALEDGKIKRCCPFLNGPSAVVFSAPQIHRWPGNLSGTFGRPSSGIIEEIARVGACVNQPLPH